MLVRRNSYSSIIDDALWEAWIEFDPFDPQYFGTLYVFGEVDSEPTLSPSITKIGIIDGELQLRVEGCVPGGTDSRELIYSEPVYSFDQYTAIRLITSPHSVMYISQIDVI